MANYGQVNMDAFRMMNAASARKQEAISNTISGVADAIAGGITKRKRKEQLSGIDMTELSYDAGLNPNKEPKTAWDFEGLDLPQLATMVSLVKTNREVNHAKAKYASDTFWTSFGEDGAAALDGADLDITIDSPFLDRFRQKGYNIHAVVAPSPTSQLGIPLAKRSTQAGEGFVKSPNPLVIDDILSPEEMQDVPSEQPVIDDILSPEEMQDVPSEQPVIDDILSPEEMLDVPSEQPVIDDILSPEEMLDVPSEQPVIEDIPAPEETPEEVSNNLIRAVLGDPDPLVLAAEAKSRWGLRRDGTDKGGGYLGVLELKGGGVATEYPMQSDAVRDPYGRRIDFPTLVPTLTDEEVELMTTDIIPNKKPVPEAIARKAVGFALQRIKAGKSVWADEEGN